MNRIIPVSVDGNLADSHKPSPVTENPWEDVARKLAHDIVTSSNPAARARLGRALKNQLVLYTRSRSDVSLLFLVMKSMQDMMIAIVPIILIVLLPACSYSDGWSISETDCWNSPKRLYFYIHILIYSMTITQCTAGAFDPLLFVYLFNKKMNKIKIILAQTVAMIIGWETLGVIIRRDLPCFNLILNFLTCTGLFMGLFWELYQYYKEKYGDKFWQMIKEDFTYLKYAVLILFNGIGQLWVYFVYTLGFFRLRAQPDLEWLFILYATVFIFTLREFFVYGMQFLYHRSGRAELTPLGQAMVYLIHATTLTFIRLACSDNIIHVLLITVCDLMSIVHGTIFVITDGFKKWPPFELLCLGTSNGSNGVIVDLSNKQMLTTMTALLLEEYVEVLIPIFFATMSLVIYFMPNSKYVISIGASACGMHAITDLGEYCKAYVILILTEFITLAMMHALISTMAGMDVFVMLDSIVASKTAASIYIPWATSLIFILWTSFVYVPMGFDCEWRFGWLQN